MKDPRAPRPVNTPHDLEPYGAPVVLLSSDETLLELVNEAFADYAPMLWTTTEQHVHEVLFSESVAAVIVDGRIVEPGACCLHVRLIAPTPLIGIAAGDSGEQRMRLLRAGADDVLARSCRPAELRARVSATVRQAVGYALPDQVVTALQIELRLLHVLERRPGSFLPVALIRHACGEDDVPIARIEYYLSDLATRLDRLGLGRIERNAAAQYRLVRQRNDLAA